MAFVVLRRLLGTRLYFQWFSYPAELRHGKPRETALHWWFTFV